MRSAWASSLAWRRTTRSKVRPGSSIVAASVAPPLSGTGVRSSSSVSKPSASTRRLAGSIVMSATDLPNRAARVASAALIVVLPTPPVPTVTTTGRSNSASICSPSRSIPLTVRGGEVSTGGSSSTSMSAGVRIPPGCSVVSYRGTGSSSSRRPMLTTLAS